MTHDRPRRGSQSITLHQKQTLIAVYQRTGNMTQAMREAGIQSPKTAYLWWHRFCEAGEAGLQPRSHARHTQNRLPDDVVEQICQLRRQEPSWGRRQIANALALRYGRVVASPASVEAVLRRKDLWEQTTQQLAAPAAPHAPGIPFWLGGRLDYGRLLELVQLGIRLSVHSEARAAIQILYGQVWRPLEADSTLWSRLLTVPDLGLGSWLLSSRLHLGHSLMNSGHWPQATHVLRETIAWMQEHRDESHQHRVEEGPHLVSLRRDDIWLGCYQHLGLVLGKSDVRSAVAYLQTALSAVRRSHRPVVPGNGAVLGDLERDLAYLKLRLRHIPKAEIRQHLLLAQQSAEYAGSPGIQAFTYIAWARLHDRLAREAGERQQDTYRQQRNLMEQALERALQLVEREQEDRPMRQTLCFVDATQLAHSHGMPIDGQRVQRAAEYCLAYGYGDQARELLSVPGIYTWLSEDVQRNLTNLV
ncbi:MAG TPA: helix-turn-helix domain-containing protein [Ktedonobacterales bacterium]|nr:helix-turn-helix domain-containing protein [Ktedonobacterales bacterium]